MFALLVIGACTAQSISTEIYHSVDKQTGISLYKTTKKGLLYGISGSYLFSSYTGASNYEELANAAIPSDGSKWGQYAKYQYGSFKENRGTLQALIGMSFGSTSFLYRFGIAFPTQYWLGKGAAILSDQNPALYFYTYQNINPIPLIGFSINQKVVNRWGLTVGWDNVQQTFMGVSYKITPTKMFNY